ncbi:MAG: PIN domain-containing protein [bacterium]|nr:PIN domain-containing protein [bacterium]
MSKLKVVLDTNVLLVSISSKSEYHWIFQALLNGDYQLHITNEILTEYEEVIAEKWNEETSKYLIRTLLE